MCKLSEIHILEDNQFLYNFDKSEVWWVEKVTDDDIKRNDDCIKKYNIPLYDIREELLIINTLPMDKEVWEDISERNDVLVTWILGFDCIKDY